MKRIIATLLAALATLVLVSARPKESLRETRLQTDIHCKNCAEKLQAKLAFEKGVHDLSIDIASKVVTIVYNPKKTDVKALVQAVEKVGYTAKVLEDKEK